MLVLAVAAVLLFHHLGNSHLQPFDEARRGTSAVEMLTGQSHPLVPTYAGRPDHWGTKPPLLIWLQTLSMYLLGVSEVAVRLPSVVATLALSVLLLWWSRRDWGSYLPGAGAVLYTLCSADFMGNHGGRSGDFDALLMFFLFLQLVSLYRYARGGHTIYLLAFGLGIMLAGWTKGVAGCFFLPGLGLWLLFDSRVRPQLLRPGVYLAGLLGLGGIVAYYLAREAIDPGYLALVWDNEVGGRFTRAREGHGGVWSTYLRFLAVDEGTRYLNLLFVPALLTVRRADRSVWLLTATVGLSFLLVISLAETKIFWYKNPLLPLIGLWLGAGALGWWRWVRGSGPLRYVGAVLLLAALALFGHAVYGMWVQVDRGRSVVNFQPAIELYRPAFTDPEFAPPFTLLIRSYKPQARFLGARAQVRGKAVTIGYSTPPPPITVGNARPTATFRVGERVVTCSDGDWDYLSQAAEVDLGAERGGCRLSRVIGLRR